MSDLNEELMLAKAFAFFDKDQSGSISTKEFVTAMTELGEVMPIEEIDLFVRLIDKNGDNEIQFEELLAALRQDAIDCSPEHPDQQARMSQMIMNHPSLGDEQPKSGRASKESSPRQSIAESEKDHSTFSKESSVKRSRNNSVGHDVDLDAL
eukprot:2667248-Pyramimonas_sp.AAC.1